MSVQIKIEDQLLIPFGSGKKWQIEDISMVGVSTTATYLTSATPLAHINKSAKRPLVLGDFCDVMPARDWPNVQDPEQAVTFICEQLRTNCRPGTPAEQKFLELYFDYCISATRTDHELLRDRPPYNDPEWVFAALLPLPQAHLYATNPLENTYEWVPSRMMMVDFAFWTGERLVAVEIDGGSHIGSEDHIRRHRLLQRSGVEVVHILNSEIDDPKYSKRVIPRLLPTELTRFWEAQAARAHRWNPFWIPF